MTYDKAKLFLVSVLALVTAGISFAIRGSIGDDLQTAGVKVDVAAIEPYRFPRTHAGHDEQAEDSLDRRGAQRRAQVTALAHEPRDLIRGVDARRDGSAPLGQQASGRHLAARVERMEVSGEPAGDAQAL